MKVQCTYRPGDPIPEAVIALGNTPSTRFDVSHDQAYLVFGIMLWKGVIHYLLVNDQTGRPNWFPDFLFKVIDNRLPHGWSFYLRGERSEIPVDAIWGYPELTQEDGRHFIDLIEREPGALQVFEHRRAGNKGDGSLFEIMKR
jgi:hypothetical protein